MGCRPLLSRLITILRRTVPFNITIVQVYARTSDYDSNEVEEFCDQLQSAIDQTPKNDILVVQGYWNAKVGKDACGNWQGMCGPFKNWKGEQCSEIDENLRKNNGKRAYQLVKDLATVKHGKASTVQDRSGKCLTEE